MVGRCGIDVVRSGSGLCLKQRRAARGVALHVLGVAARASSVEVRLVSAARGGCNDELEEGGAWIRCLTSHNGEGDEPQLVLRVGKIGAGQLGDG